MRLVLLFVFTFVLTFNLFRMNADFVRQPKPVEEKPETPRYATSCVECPV